MSEEKVAEEIQETTVEEAPTQEAANGQDAAAEPLTLEEQLTAVQAEVEEYKDRWLRSQAEFANARKRMEK
ncbi:MAG: nucleotide exchange factor GrpE, partial [Ardenticatenaceae bacterium]|nr:nucleotide exchange factor GrpE [Ardenticatenaceae bacterium]